MSNWKKKIGLVALVAAPLVAAGSWLALRDTSLPANNLYVETRAQQEKDDFKKWIDEARTGVRFDSDPTLAEMIEHLGYVHKRSNVSSLDEAQLICLGEIHKLCGNEEAFVLGHEFVGKEDKILYEAFPSGKVRNFPAEEIARIEADKIYREKIKQPFPDVPKLTGNPEEDFLSHMEDISNLFRVMSEGLEATSKSWELNGKHLEDLFERDGREDSFFNSLARDNKGIVIGADADDKTKNSHLYTIVESGLLPLYSASIKDGVKVHPLLEWLAYDATLAVKPTDSNDEKIRKASDYVSKLPSFDDCMRRRDEQIVRNTIREVKSAKDSQRVWYIFGAKHLDALFEPLEKEGIRYVAFAADSTKVSKDSWKEDFGTDGSNHSEDYFFKHIMPWYISERVAAGAKPYTGTFKGLLK